MSAAQRANLGDLKPTPLAPLRREGEAGLPQPLTPLVGREREMAAVAELVARATVRLVTLTGPGGIGKTRLALAVAATAGDAFADGVSFVPLVSLTDPELVLPTVARTLGMRDGGDRALPNALIEFLRPKRLLLVLDNFEQVVEAGRALAQLLTACPGLTALVTSREALRLTGERTYPVPPLPLPDASIPPSEQPAESAAIRLFVERAQAANPAFAIGEANTATIAAICARLDGLPLAIELAAARMAHLSPAALLTRLDHRLPLLSRGTRDLATRHQTMRDAIAWSYALLTPDEQALFRQLAAYSGSFALDAAEAVSGGGLDLLASLVGKSLLRQDEGADAEPRYTILETIREYGLEQLAAAGEEDGARRRHADYFLELAELGASQLGGPERGTGLRRLEAEYPNLRAALAWGIAQGASELVQRLVVALGRFWEERGLLSEGRVWAERALTVGADDVTPLRARALYAASTLIYRQGDYAQATALLEAGLAISRVLDNTEGIARALNGLGNVAFDQGDYARALAIHGEALALRRSMGDRAGIASSLNNLAITAREQRAYDQAVAFHEEALEHERALGDMSGVGYALNGLGVVIHRQGDLIRAAALLEEAVALRRQWDTRAVTASLANLADVVRDQGDLARAAALYQESLVLRWERGEKFGIAESLSGLVGIAASGGAPDLAVRLFGAVDSLRRAIGASQASRDHLRSERDATIAATMLGPDAAAAAQTAGQTIPLEQVVAEALAFTPSLSIAPPTAPEAPPHAIGLTPRELDVLRLVVEGHSDREIGQALFISHRTVMTHVTNILAKLGVDSRTAAASHAIRLRLV